VNLDLSITPHMDASNGEVDMFSLTVVAGGVNDTGSLAASIASGAHSLMGAQVGTFRQRMGVFTQLGDSDKGAWVRVFGDKGTIDPDVHLDNLPQGGAFKFDQTNSGIEAGVNALVTDGWYVGASIGGSKGKQDLVDGFGRDDIDGMTLGGYLTWIGAQGYADISYRWMDFDAEMTSAAGVQEVGGNAGALNIEAGWNAWTSASGLQLVPQVQYTRTTADVDTVHGEFTDFVADGGTSSRARVGLELQQTFKSGDTTWTPYGVLSAVRELQGEQRFSIGDVFTGHTSTQGTSAQVEFGVNARIGRADVWGGLNWTDGGALDSFIGGQIGVRYTW
jgi:outer membrane autotransporter protein